MKGLENEKCLVFQFHIQFPSALCNQEPQEAQFSTVKLIQKFSGQ